MSIAELPSTVVFLLACLLVFLVIYGLVAIDAEKVKATMALFKKFFDAINPFSGKESREE